MSTSRKPACCKMSAALALLGSVMGVCSTMAIAAVPSPSNLKAIPGNGFVTLVWQRPDVLKTEKYNIYRSTTQGNTGTVPYAANVNTVVVPTVMNGGNGQDGVTILKDFGDTAVTNGTTYYYQVTLVRNGEESAKTAEVSVTPLSASHAITKSRFLKIMPMGNSITGGWAWSANNQERCGPKGGYRGHLYDSLKAAGYHFELVGSCLDCSEGASQKLYQNHEGWGSRQVQDIQRTVLRRALNSYDPDMILLEIGTNNFAWGGSDVNGALRAYDSLLRITTSLKPNLMLLVAPILPLSNSYWTPFNTGVKKKADSLAALGKKVTWVDEMSSITLNQLGPDHIHPYESTYLLIASKWFQAIKRVTETMAISMQRPKGAPPRASRCSATDFANGNYDRIFTFRGELVSGVQGAAASRQPGLRGIFIRHISNSNTEVIVR